MKYLQIPGISAPMSILGFGCAPLLGRAGRSASMRALSAAYDLGITLFDTARSYGYGRSETLLGEFLRGKRDRVVVCTKFGILPSAQPAWKRAAKPLIRGLLAVVPSARRHVQNRIKSEFTADQFTAGSLQASFDESLRQLRTDYVDMLLMHSPSIDALGNHELIDKLKNLVLEGKARSIGISGDAHTIDFALRNQFPFSTFQFACNPFDLVSAPQTSQSLRHQLCLMANHPFGGATRVEQLRRLFQNIASSSDTPPELASKISKTDDGALADATLNLILKTSQIQTVIPAMINPAHIKRNVEAITHSRFSNQDLAWLRNKLSPGKESSLQQAV